jgi:hypothetical protein
MYETKTPNFDDILGELNAGIFKQQLEAALKQIAVAVINHGDKGKKGKLVMSLSLERLENDTGMVNVESKWEVTKPKVRGKSVEDDTTSTIMCVSPQGLLSLYPLKQANLFPKTDKAGE